MHSKTILRILGLLVMLFSLTMIPPLCISLYYQDHATHAFLTGFIVTLTTGFFIWLPFHNNRDELRTKDGFVITALFWLVPGLFCSIPLYLGLDGVHIDYVDAFFESLSGLTTTGATVIQHLDDLPKSILYYRQQLQWLGGMGIIVLAIAILPMLGVGGMQLYRAEAPGPVKDSKLTPRITETAKTLWYIYLGLTIACGLAYWMAGMSVFDALAHSFSTVAIGGFSTHDASIGYFNSRLIEMIAVVFMILSAVNFGLHFFAWRTRNPFIYLRDAEFKFFIGGLALAVVMTWAVLFFSNTYDFENSFFYALFEVVSIATTTGFATADFNTWPLFLPFMLLTLSFVGGCAGSTGGGMKVVRVLLIYKQGLREVKRLIHPNTTISIKLGNQPVSDRVISAVWGFFSVYVIFFMLLITILLATGMDHVTAWSAVSACMNNLGPGLDGVSLHYADINDVAKVVLCFAMLLGRLEIFTILVLLTPAFWRE